jgi:hypothetical protein
MSQVTLLVTVQLDLVAGAFHKPDDAAQRVQQILIDRIGHYNPKVEIFTDRNPPIELKTPIDPDREFYTLDGLSTQTWSEIHQEMLDAINGGRDE